MDWRSEILLQDNILSAQDAVPEGILNEVRDAINSYNSYHSENKLDAILIDLIGCILYKKLTMEHLPAIFATSDSTKNEFVMNAIADALWFWGTQVSQHDTPVGQKSTPSEQWMLLCLLVKEMDARGYVDGATLRKTLELNLLVGAGICRDEAGLQKRLVKLNTTMVYRQQKYNLLREETEGFSKLLTVLSTLPCPPHDPALQIKQVFSIIGYFDLDPNRVIDIILEVMEQQIWNTSFLTLLKSFRKANVCHIVGFKLSHYRDIAAATEGSVSAPPSSNDATVSSASLQSPLNSISTPPSLYMLIAVLLSEDMIEIEGVLPYLSPTLLDIAKNINAKSADLKKEILMYGVVNLSAKSTPVPPVPPVPPPPDARKDAKVSPSVPIEPIVENKKVVEVVSNTDPLLRLGNRIPSNTAHTTTWLTENETQLIDKKINSTNDNSLAYAEGVQFIGIISALLSLRNWNLAQKMIKLFSDVDLTNFTALRESLIALIDWRISPLLSLNGLSKMRLCKSSTVLTSSVFPHIPILPTSSNGLQVQCSQVDTIDTFFSEIVPMMEILGHNLSSSPTLFTKICRILKPYVEKLLPTTGSANVSQSDGMEIEGVNHIPPPSSDINISPDIINVGTMISTLLLPAFSKFECNPMVANCLWEVMNLLPFQVRYKGYEAWRGEGFGKHAIDSKPLPVVFAECKILHGVKAQLKRLSKENIKQSGRQIAKYTHSCSLVVFDFILNQIETYDNMIPFVVEALRYTTDLARDVLSFALLSQLHKDSDKLKPGDTHYSHWFHSLTRFIGSFYKKYPSTELRGLLHFLLQKLSQSESLDLLVLKELLGRMGGCETMLEVSSDQLEGLSGGKSLQAEVMGAQVKDAANKKAIRILRETMLSSGTAMPLLLFIAQARSKILFKFDTSQLKLISYLYDMCQDVLMQFTDFLIGGAKSVESMVEVMPSMEELVNTIGLAIPVAFQLVRPLVRAALQYGEDPLASPLNLQKWHPFGTKTKELMVSLLPSEVWNSISPELYLTFWSLSLYDLNVPTQRYELEIKRLKDKYLELDTKAPNEDDKGGQKQRRQDMTKYLNFKKTLTEECDIQKKHVDTIRKLLMAHKSSYFSHVSRENHPRITENLMQYCVYPRILMSPCDATYCSQFFLLLHQLETPAFSTIHFLHTTTKHISPLIFCCTEYEAGFIGFFVNDLLTTCNRWVANKQLFMREAESKCCFQKEFDSKNDVRINHDQYSKVFQILHNRLKVVTIACLKSPEYMHIRSALVFLSKVGENYPSRVSAGKAILGRVEQLEKDEKDRGDLQLMARSLLIIFKRRQNAWVDDESKDKKTVGTAQPPPNTASQAPTSSRGNSIARPEDGSRKRPLEYEPSVSSSTAQSSSKGVIPPIKKLASGGNASSTPQPPSDNRDNRDSGNRDTKGSNKDTSNTNNSRSSIKPILPVGSKGPSGNDSASSDMASSNRNTGPGKEGPVKDDNSNGRSKRTRDHDHPQPPEPTVSDVRNSNDKKSGTANTSNTSRPPRSANDNRDEPLKSHVPHEDEGPNSKRGRGDSRTNSTISDNIPQSSTATTSHGPRDNIPQNNRNQRPSDGTHSQKTQMNNISNSNTSSIENDRQARFGGGGRANNSGREMNNNRDDVKSSTSRENNNSRNRR